MCGISVICEFGAATSTLDVLRSMHARVKHRGPDGEGWLAVDADWKTTVTTGEAALRDAVGDRPLRVAAAFRWLQIQDPRPTSHQPMGSASGDVWVLFNGEIYNHRDLRRDLIGHGFAFRTYSDTEVLLVAYQHWGDRCFERLNGMWGAVIIDTRNRTVTFSRDRFGIRPLFYSLDGQRLLVGSEAKQLACLGSGRPAANRDAVLGFLAGRRLPCEQTYFAGVHALPAAASTIVPLDASAPDSLRINRYWTLYPPSSRDAVSSLSLAAASARLEELLHDSIALQAVAAVPVGALLSGGLDSSVVSRFLVDARRREGEHSSLVSVTAEDAVGLLDERPYMRAMAQALAGDDVTAIESSMDPFWVAASMDRVTWHQEEPLPGVALVAHDHAYHAAAAHGIRVVLEGTGSDEIFAGYPRHQLARIRDHVRKRQWVGAARELTGAWRRDDVFGPWVRDVVGQSVRRRLGMATGARPGWLGQDLPLPATATSAPPPAPRELSLLAQMSCADVTRGNIPAVLAVTDRNAMAHSVESRVPFLDHRVVEFAFGLPDDFKTRRGALKIVLRAVARRRLPALIAERRGRIGFGMPIADWMRHALKPSLIETVNGPEVTRNDVFDPAKTQRFVTEFLQERHEDVASVWRIYALARWLRAYRAAV